MLKFRLFTIFAAVLLLAGSFAVAQPVLENQGAASARLPGGAAILLDQTDNASGNGSPDQDFETSFDIYDSLGADDFVTNPEGWNIDGIETIGTGGGSQSLSVTFYADGGNEEPDRDDVLCEYLNLVPGADYTDAGGSMSITLPTACNIGGGTTAWLHVYTSQVFGGGGGQHFWSNRTVQDNAGAVWKNPGNGFGTGCVDWTTMTFCGVGGGFPDFLFQILGEKKDGGTTDGTPAVGPFGVLLMVLALGGGSGYVMARRRRA